MRAAILAALLLATPAFADDYSQLGTVDQQTKFYSDGEFFYHPSGVTYIHQDGNWVIYNPPVTASVPEPDAFFLAGSGLIALAWLARRRNRG